MHFFNIVYWNLSYSINEMQAGKKQVKKNPNNYLLNPLSCQFTLENKTKNFWLGNHKGHSISNLNSENTFLTSPYSSGCGLVFFKSVQHHLHIHPRQGTPQFTCSLWSMLAFQIVNTWQKQYSKGWDDEEGFEVLHRNLTAIYIIS